jgi:hypothetical protein
MMIKFQNEHFKRFIDFAFPASGCLELAFWSSTYSRDKSKIVPYHIPLTYGGWFDSVPHLRGYARMADGVSAYVTVNPVTADKLAQAKTRSSVSASRRVPPRNILSQLNTS